MIVLARGRLIAEGKPTEIRDHPKVQEVYFGSGRTFEKRKAGGRLMDALLEAKALDAWYGAAQILFDVDLEVRRGEVVALMGRNGAGKSTTLKALMGMLAKRSGSDPLPAATTCRRRRRTRSRDAASATSPRTGACSAT